MQSDTYIVLPVDSRIMLQQRSDGGSVALEACHHQR